MTVPSSSNPEIPEEEIKTLTPPTPEPEQTTQYSLLTDRQLFIFGIAQLLIWALNAGNILATSFILPVVSQDFNVSPTDVQWVAASNMLTWGCLQLIAGRLCDIFGRKRGYIIGCVSSVLFNIMATFMPNLASLNVARALAGVSAAIILPASSGLIGSLYAPGKKRTIAYAAISCGECAGAGLGELIAGAFIVSSRWTWRPVYLSCGLITLIPLFIGMWLVPPDAPIKKDWSVDWIGASAILASSFLLLFSMTVSGTSSKGWKTPLIPRGLLSWKNRNLWMIYIASASLWACIDGLIPFISYLYLDVIGLDAFQAGLRMSTCFFSGVPAAIVVGLTISRVPPRALMSIGVFLSTFSPLLFAIRQLDWPFWRADLWAFLFIGWGTDSVVAAGSSLISHTASQDDQSVASALFQTSCRLGFAVSLDILTLIQGRFENRALHAGKTAEQATVTGLRAAFWTCYVFIVIAMLVLLFGMQGWACIHDTGHGEIEDEREQPSLIVPPQLQAEDDPKARDMV